MVWGGERTLHLEIHEQSVLDQNDNYKNCVHHLLTFSSFLFIIPICLAEKKI